MSCYKKLDNPNQTLFELSECKRQRTFDATPSTLSNYDGKCSCYSGYVGKQLKPFEFTPDAERQYGNKPIYGPGSWKGWCGSCPKQAMYYEGVSQGGTLPGVVPQTRIQTPFREDPYVGV